MVTETPPAEAAAATATSLGARGEARVAGAAPRPTPLAGATRARILTYVGGLILLLGLGSPFGGLIDVPVSFFLKNKLHLSASAVAAFRLAAAVPLYLSFAFGFARDRWNPLGRGDRGFLILFGGVAALAYGAFAFLPPTYLGLLAAVIVLTAAYLFSQSAQAGLTSALGQQHVMAGQMSAVWSIFLAVPTLVGPLAGGLLSDQLEGKAADAAARTLFLIGAGFMGLVAVFGLWRPPAVFDNLRAERDRRANLLADIGRLLRHAPVYPALIVWFLWNFAPGSQTPLQYFLQNTLHASDAEWGAWNAIQTLCFIPTYLLFGLLCQRMPLRRLLFWGTLVGIPQAVPMLFLHSMTGAFIAAAASGLMGGVCTAAYLDLIIRSCPQGLQGTMLMLSSTAFYVAARGGDVLGTWLYDRFGGFPICVVAITVAYALILPVLRLIPRRLIDTADGQSPTVAYSAD